MKKALIIIFGLLLITQFTACESDSNSNDSSSSNYSEKNIVVTGVSSDVIDGQSGDRYQYSGAGWRVIVTSSTKIYVQRESCSGLSSGNPSDIRNGMTIFFKFKPEEANYQGSPNIARATKIEGYLSDCISSGSGVGVEVVTNTVTETFTITGTTVITNIIRR
jgi:hypothetical protein